MKRKTWALASLALLLAAIAAICLTVIVIDPFQVYRPATRYLPPIDRTTQVYANAGVARSYAYDSARCRHIRDREFPAVADGFAARRPLYQAVHLRRNGL